LAPDNDRGDLESLLDPEETTKRREFADDEATVSVEDFDETTPAREYTEALAREKALAGSVLALEPPDTAENHDIKQMLQPPAHLQQGSARLPRWPQDDRLRVLVVERDQQEGQALCQLLEQAGHAALVVDSGEELVRAVTELRPALILLRVELSPHSGYLICNKLKEHEELRQVPLLLISTEATDEVFKQHRKLATRADDYLIKPFEERVLLQKVGRLGGTGAASLEDPAAARTKEEGFPTWLLLVVALLVIGAAVTLLFYLI